MSEWKKYELGDVVDIKHGYAFKGEFFSKEPTSDILLTPGNFKIGGGFKEDKFKYYNGNYPDSYILKEGDIIVTMTDLSKEADTLGYSAKVPPHNGIKYLHNQRLGLLQFKTSELDKDYVYWLLRTKTYQLFIANSATGTTVRHTSPTRIKEFEFYAPDKDTQTRIASILSSLDDKIELNRQTNQTLEAIAQTLFKEMCVPKGGELEDGWRVGKLGELMVSKGGTTPSTKNDEYWDGEFNWATPKDLSNLKSPVLLSTERKITDKGLKQISSGLLPKGTLLMSSRAPIGYFAISQIPVAINQGFIAINGTSLSNLFLLHWLKLNLETIKSMGNGSTFLEISKSVFREIEIIIPTKKVLDNFDNLVIPIFQNIITNEQEIQTLTTLRDSLLPRLMKGEL